jgi:acetyl esterase/lipase
MQVHPISHLMKSLRPVLLLIILTLGFQMPGLAEDPKPGSLQAARKGFQTKLLPRTQKPEPLETAPAKVFRTVKYPATSGQLGAYLTPDPSDGKRHPAILWITGGDPNTISDVWSPASRDNDQSAAAYRKAGITMMFPSLRGGNDNPGTKEGFLGEVDDVLAAARFLATQPYVDTNRIYLGGHSTGGTLALLVSESTSVFRAVFAFGPVDDIRGYGFGKRNDYVPVDLNDETEARLRSPFYWLGSIQSPTWVLEGRGGARASLRSLASKSSNPKIRFIEVRNADHFTILAPVNELIAQAILRDTGERCSLKLEAADVNRHFDASRKPTP